jgi:hypothetical protein
VVKLGDNMIKIKALRDESSHWYLVPNEFCDEFNKLQNKLSCEEYPDRDNDEKYFIEKFSQYMTGGDLNNVQLYID